MAISERGVGILLFCSQFMEVKQLDTMMIAGDKCFKLTILNSIFDVSLSTSDCVDPGRTALP